MFSPARALTHCRDWTLVTQSRDSWVRAGLPFGWDTGCPPDSSLFLRPGPWGFQLTIWWLFVSSSPKDWRRVSSALWLCSTAEWKFSQVSSVYHISSEGSNLSSELGLGTDEAPQVWPSGREYWGQFSLIHGLWTKEISYLWATLPHCKTMMERMQ